MSSIRGYLLTRLVGGAALVLAAAGLCVYLLVARSLEEQFDRNLADSVRGFASILFQSKQSLSFEFSDELMPEYDSSELPAYFQLRLSTGQLVERSNSLGDADLELPVEPTEEPQHWTGPLPDGRTGRYVTQLVEVHHVYPEEGPERPQAARVQITIARGREQLVAAEREVLWSSVAAVLALIALIALSTLRAVDRGLEPAERVGARLDAIRVDELPDSLNPDWLGTDQLPRELRPVAEKTQALIERLGVALERERRTAADIAHELRTPISELLTVSEVALRARNGRNGVATNGQAQEQARQALGTIRDVAWRMGNSVSTLLRLARLEMGDESFETEPVLLAPIVDELLRSLLATADQKSIRVESSIPEHATLIADREALRIVLANLLSNALYYAPSGSQVSCRLERQGQSWTLSVENRAEGLTPDELPSLSSPFWKRDPARTDRDRSGLGLALSAALAEATAMKLSFELQNGLFRALLSA